jgi:hypothetical protein
MLRKKLLLLLQIIHHSNYECVERPFFVQKLEPNATIPPSYLEAIRSGQNSDRFLSITRTSEEISIVGETSNALPM